MAKIIVDPGHGQGDNVGANGYREGTVMWHFGQFLQSELESRGHVVVNTRPLITNEPSLSLRGGMAFDADLFISLHSNANSNPSLRGVAIYDSVADKEDEMESELCAVISRTMGSPNLGIRNRESNVNPGDDYYGVLRNAVLVGCPNAMLAEHSYHTNPQDAAWLMDHNNLRKLAIAEADCITKYYKGENVKIGIVQVNTVLNVRSAPSAGASDIGDLLNGQPVLILSTENGWHKIAWADGVAFVSDKYVGIYNEVSIPAPDYQATITEKDEKIDFLTKEIFASQERYKEAESEVLKVSAKRDEYLNDLLTLAKINFKYTAI